MLYVLVFLPSSSSSEDGAIVRFLVGLDKLLPDVLLRLSLEISQETPSSSEIVENI